MRWRIAFRWSAADSPASYVLHPKRKYPVDLKVVQAGSYRIGINDPNRTFWHFCKKWPRLSVSSSGQKIHFMASKNHLNLWPLVIGQSRFVPQVVYTYTAIQRDTAWLWSFKQIKSKTILYLFDILFVFVFVYFNLLFEPKITKVVYICSRSWHSAD